MSGPNDYMHYVPRFLLKRFKPDTGALLELDKDTGVIQPRTVSKAGQEPGLYSPEIEDGILKRLDDYAAQLFRRKLFGKDEIIINEEEKLKLSEWLLFFAVRIPHNRLQCNATAKAHDTLEMKLNHLNNEYEDVFAQTKAAHPERFRNLTAGGERIAKAQLYNLLRRNILLGPPQQNSWASLGSGNCPS